MNVELRKSWAQSKPREQRLAVSHVQVREHTDGTGLDFSGYASVTGPDAAYDVRDFLGEYKEQISPGAFRKSLGELSGRNEKDDVRLLVNHDGVPLARTKSGTLTIREITNPKDDPQELGQTGAWCGATLDGASPLVQTVRSAMARKDMDQMSIAFQAIRQEWNADYTSRIITEAKLFDVSVVTYPASPTTSAGLRDARSAAALQLSELVNEARERAGLSEHHITMLTSMLAQLADGDAALDPIVSALSKSSAALDAAQTGMAMMLGIPDPDPADPADAMTMASAGRAQALRRSRLKMQQALRTSA